MNQDPQNGDKKTTTRAGDRRASLHEDSAAWSDRDAIEGDEIAVGSNMHWPLVIVGGASLVAGTAAILAPLVAGFAVAITLGFCLVFCGAVGAMAAFRERDYWHTAGAFAVSLMAIAAGAVMLLQPATGIVALGTLIIAWFAASGILRVYYGLRRWSEPRKTGSGWMVALGVVSIFVALMLWFAMPHSLVWLPGVVVGIDLILWGALLLALGLSSDAQRGLAAS